MMSQDTNIGFHLAVRPKNKEMALHSPAEWIYHGGYSNIVNLRRTCALVQIGVLPLGVNGDYLKQFAPRIPHVAPHRYRPVEQVFTSRIWFKEAISLFQAGGVITCPNVELLEDELSGIASRAKKAWGSTRQYVVCVSQRCC
ncbi:hypothetical protein BC834DRAFT_896297 [Gloeopeniophorella convolvens]|nr:hypothetical protein BC834DRAFT_896297 [Gloeopeniophorella convolvens]